MEGNTSFSFRQTIGSVVERADGMSLGPLDERSPNILTVSVCREAKMVPTGLGVWQFDFLFSTFHFLLAYQVWVCTCNLTLDSSLSLLGLPQFRCATSITASTNE